MSGGLGSIYTALESGNWPEAEVKALSLIMTEAENPEVWPKIWQALALAQDRQNKLTEAFDSYQKLLTLLPAPPPADVIHDLARLAFRLDQMPTAEKLYRFVVQAEPENVTAIAGLGASLRQQMRYDEAVDILKSALEAYPEDDELWNVLGTVVGAKGDAETALLFFDEALRLNPDNVQTRFHRGCTYAELSQLDLSFADLELCIDGFHDPSNIASVRLSAAQICLAAGDLERAWPLYEARHKRGTPLEVHYPFKAPRWTPDMPLTGKRLFVSAEQGLGDEILFGTMLPDVVRGLGDERLLSLGVEPRLVPLFQRAFPLATVVAHKTRRENGRITRTFPDLNEVRSGIQMWALMADFCSLYRPEVAAFPAENAYLIPDLVRVNHWQNWLSGLGHKPKIGLLWKSLKSDVNRDRYYSPFAQWEAVLRRDDVTFINLQYGDTEAELEAANTAGIEIITPPEIDLKNDLDDLCALTCALNITLGPANATTNISAAAGARTWIITSPRNWVQLGENYYPWYPTARAFMPKDLTSWPQIMAEVANALREFSAPYKD